MCAVVANGDLDILSFVECRVIHDDHASRREFGQKVLHNPKDESFCRFVLGLGTLIQRVTLTTPTQKRLVTCEIVKSFFSLSDNPYGEMRPDMSSVSCN